MSAASALDEPSGAVPWRQDASIIGLVGMAHAASHFGHLLLPPLFPVFMQTFDLSYAQLGLLMTVFFVISGVGQALAGFVVDRLGARPLLFVAIGLFMLVCLLAAWANSYTGLLVVAALSGLANATFHPVDFTILNHRVSGPRLGHAFSAHGLAGNLGWALAPVFLVTLSLLMDWRKAYLAAAMVYALVLAVLYLNRGKLLTAVVARSAQQPGEHSLAFMRQPVVWWCFAFFTFSTITLAVIQNFSVSILRAMHGISFQSATLTVTAYMLCGAAGVLAGGFVAARARSVDRVVASAMAVSAALMVLCATGWLGATVTMVVLASTGFAIGIAGPSRDLMVRKVTPKGATGRVYGLVYSGFDTGLALAPLMFGLLMDQQQYALTLVGAAMTLALSVFIALGVGQRTLQGTSPARA